MPALKSCVIVALYLGNNSMGDKGVTSLADGLRHARGLQTLHLNDNEASSETCNALRSFSSYGSLMPVVWHQIDQQSEHWCWRRCLVSRWHISRMIYNP